MGCSTGRRLTPHPQDFSPQPVSGIDLLHHPSHLGQPQRRQGDVITFAGLLGCGQDIIAPQSPAKPIFFANVILSLTPATTSTPGQSPVPVEEGALQTPPQGYGEDSDPRAQG